MGAERHAAGVDVRARDVHLVGVDGRILKRFDDLHIFVEAVAGDVHDGRGSLLAQPGELLALQMGDAGVLQADRVQHARRDLGNARARVAFPAVEGDTLRRDGP